jgi:hypothetical protein
MLNIKGQNLVVVILITVILTELAALLLLKPAVYTALAQEGGSSGNKISNNENVNGTTSAFLVASVEESTIGTQSDGSGIEVISNGAFRNDGDNVDGWFNFFAEGYISNDSLSGACFMAPTYPPNGATLTQFRISILDQNANSDFSFIELNRVRLATGVVEVIAGGNVPYNDPTPVELIDISMTPGTALVSSAYAYYVDLCFPGGSGTDILLYGARLFYTP